MGFLRAGVMGFGGGAVCLPLIQKEAVDKYSWFTNDEFSELVAISNTLPGPINTKMAGYIGYRVAGLMGAIIAICATILPSAILLIILLETLSAFRQHPVVAGMRNAIQPVIAVMLGLMSWQFLASAAKKIKWVTVFANVVIVTVLIVVVGLHPAIIVTAVIAFALFKPTSHSIDTKEESK